MFSVHASTVHSEDTPVVAGNADAAWAGDDGQPGVPGQDIPDQAETAPGPSDNALQVLTAMLMQGKKRTCRQ